MRGGALPPALIFAALGIALGFADRRARWVGAAAACLIAAATAFAPIPTDWVEGVFIGCWASVALTALSIHLPGGLPRRAAYGLSANAGLWAGAVTAVAAKRIDLIFAIPLVLLCLPAAWLAGTRRGLVVKVAGSWLIAVAVLCACLAFIPTPGYKPDHMG